MALKRLKPAVASAALGRVAPARKTADRFYTGAEWQRLRNSLIATRGRRCEACGKAREEDGSPVLLHGDHITEIRDGGAPLDPANIRLLCVRSGGDGAGGVGGCHNRKTAAERAKRFARGGV